MERTVKSNPENLIRELIIKKYGTLDNACNTLDIGTRQGLNNNLRRWAEKEGTFKAFYKVLSELGYKIEYYAIPILNKDFDYDKFSSLLDEGATSKASRMIDKEYKSRESLDTTEYLELRNQLEVRKRHIEGEYRTVVTFPENYIKSIIDFNPSKDFPRNLNFIVEGYLKLEKLLPELEKIIDSSPLNNKSLMKDKIKGVYFEKVEATSKVFVKKIMADSEEIWLKTVNDALYDVSNFFSDKSLKKFKVRKNIEKLEIDFLKLSGQDIIYVSGCYEGNPFIGEYCSLYNEFKKINF